MGQHVDDDLSFVLETFDKERTDGSVDQTTGQCFFFRWTTFTLEKSTRDLASGIGLFLVVYGEREKIQPRLWFSVCNNGGQHRGVTIGGDNSAICLTGNSARFNGERAPTPFDRFLGNIKHIYSLERVTERRIAIRRLPFRALVFPMKTYCSNFIALFTN